MSIEEQIADLVAEGYIVVRRRDSKDDQLRDLWSSIQKQLRMARDIAEDGGKLVVHHPAWLNQKADAAHLLRHNAMVAIDVIFANVVVERTEERADAAD